MSKKQVQAEDFLAIVCREFGRVLPTDFDPIETALAVGYFQAVATATLYRPDSRNPKQIAALFREIRAGRHISAQRLEDIGEAAGRMDLVAAGISNPFIAKGVQMCVLGGLALSRTIIAVPEGVTL